MQLLALVGTLSRGEGTKNLSRSDFFFCFDPSFVSAEMGVDYPINLPKIKTPWLRGVFLYIFNYFYVVSLYHLFTSITLRHAEGRVEVVQLEPMVEDVRNLRNFPPEILAKNGTSNASGPPEN